MEIIHTETNRGKKAIIVDGYTYRKINILKSGDVVYICSVDKKCTKSITTDAEGVAIIRTKNQHVCEYNPSDRKSEAKQLRVRSRKNSGDVSKRPSTVVRNELKTLQESHLEPKDIKNASLALFFGLPFLTPDSIEDSFVEDIMGDAPNDNRCHQFADYILDGYVAETSSYPPLMWAAVPDERNKRTNNGPEAFHSHFNGQFYTSHPNIFVFLDVLKQIQTTTYVKMRSLNNEALVRRAETERLRYSIDKYNDFRTGSISRLNYISALGYKFSACCQKILKDFYKHFLLEILLPPPRGEQGATGLAWLTEEKIFTRLVTNHIDKLSNIYISIYPVNYLVTYYLHRLNTK
ncbi:hypothetical protein KUTeg_018500 [Tegillarca granosa]|uniref:FLYWCH-type domain-containing protein n=1 Tax=Tegillarca granosa TaxID=220873 RepID=A0ABQ9EMU7_TEGGR|nr:hypothetical protein KUTeg_018500 [Tegillarca granosa]